MKKGAAVIGMLDPFSEADGLDALAKTGIALFAMELMPRISRAQSMDVLSSQSNLAGYKAVVDAAAAFERALPMMMTAAGTVPAARVFVMGVGVAGLQAIATARRLGAIVTATDVRPAVKEQVASLGAKFIAVEDEEFKQAETAAGYAKEMSDDYKKKQAALIAEHVKNQDIVITTALIPGRPAPKLISKEMIESMRPAPSSSISRSSAAAMPSSPSPERSSSTTACAFWQAQPAGRGAGECLEPLRPQPPGLRRAFDRQEERALAINWDDDLVKGTLIARDGAIVNAMIADRLGAATQGATPAKAATGKAMRKRTAPSANRREARHEATNSLARARHPRVRPARDMGFDRQRLCARGGATRGRP